MVRIHAVMTATVWENFANAWMALGMKSIAVATRVAVFRYAVNASMMRSRNANNIVPMVASNAIILKKPIARAFVSLANGFIPNARFK